MNRANKVWYVKSVNQTRYSVWRANYTRARGLAETITQQMVSYSKALSALLEEVKVKEPALDGKKRQAIHSVAIKRKLRMDKYPRNVKIDHPTFLEEKGLGLPPWGTTVKKLKKNFPIPSKTNDDSTFMAFLKAILKALLGRKTSEKPSSRPSFYKEFKEALHNPPRIISGRAKRLKYAFVTKAKPLIEAYYSQVQVAATSPRYEEDDEEKKEALQKLKRQLEELKEKAKNNSQLFFLFPCQGRVKGFFTDCALLSQKMLKKVECAIEKVNTSDKSDNKGDEEYNFEKKMKDLKRVRNKLKALDIQNEHLEKESHRLNEDAARIKEATTCMNETILQMKKNYTLLKAMVENYKREKKSPNNL